MFIPDVDTAEAGDVIRAKWLFDGCSTLEEAAEVAAAAALQLRALASAGWTLVEPISDDYGFLVDPQGSSGEPSEEDMEDLLDDEDSDL